MALPAVYQTDDYLECINKGQNFCMVVAKLNSSEISIREKLMGEYDMTYKLDRSYIHRGFCLPPNLDGNQNLIKQTTNLLNSQLSAQNLFSNIDEIYCQTKVSQMSTTDTLLLLFVFIVCCCVCTGTFLDIKKRKYKNSLEKILTAFSVKENWKKITQTEGNEDFSRLKSMQGLRALTNMGVLCLHAIFNITTMYYHNPEVLELIFTSTFLQVIMILSTFFVHIFLLISAFLISNQVYYQYEKNGYFTFREYLVLMIKRYLRLYTTTFFFVYFSSSTLLVPLLGVPSLRVYSANKIACEKRWGVTMLFANNFLHFEDMCYAPTWYLAADFQSYILLVLLIYFILKYKLNFFKIMTLALMTSLTGFGMIIYFYEQKDIILKLNFRDIQHLLFKNEIRYWVMYSSTISTLPTSITGVIFGYIYFKLKKFKLQVLKPVYQILWSILFFGLPAISVYLSFFRYNRLSIAVIGSVIKVIFTTGVAVGILGMSYGLGGKIKTFLEGKYNILLGNISFCAYLVNYIIWMVSNAGGSYVRTLDTWLVVFNITKDLLLSLLLGLLLSLTIEFPSFSLLKMLPQLGKGFVERNKKH